MEMQMEMLRFYLMCFFLYGTFLILKTRKRKSSGNTPTSFDLKGISEHKLLML